MRPENSGLSASASDGRTSAAPSKKYRYKGTIPLSMSPWAVGNIGAVFLGLTQMCKSTPVDAANLTIDLCTDTGNPGILTVITEGPVARQIGKLTTDERKKAVLDAVAERFGEKALSPVDYLEQNWAIERYSAGANAKRNGGLTRAGQEFDQRCEPALRLRLPHVPLIGRPSVGGRSVDDQLEQPRLTQGSCRTRVQSVEARTDHTVIHHPTQPVLSVDEFLYF